ncbi:hypothetical protein K7432_005203 [Basidiobolus ranarum]
MVFDQIESKLKIKKLYGVFFRLLEHDALRHSVCHLLFLITGREHVKSFRVHKLMDLYNRVNSEPGLCSLLKVYKDYCPNLFSLHFDIPKGAFKAPDIAWVECLSNIHINSSDSTTGYSTVDFGFSGQTGSDQLNNIDSLVLDLSVKDLPQQFTSVLDSHLLQLFVTTHPDKAAFKRIETWACDYLVNLAIWRDQNITTKNLFQGLLKKICDALEMNKSLFYGFEGFLTSYLCYWDGRACQKEIFTMVSHMPLKPFNELHKDFLNPLHKLYLISSEAWKASLIDCYTCLLRNWSLAEWPLASKSDDSHVRFERIQTIRGFAAYVEKVLVIGLEAEKNSIHLLHKVLEFYEEMTAFSLECGVPLLTIPNRYILCSSLFNISLMPISRICGILARCKSSYEWQRNLKITNGSFSLGYEREHVTQLNINIMDACNCLWRGQALNYTDPNTSGFGLDSETIREIEHICQNAELSLSCLFGLTQSPVFLPLSLEFLKGLENEAGVTVHHQGPISSASLRILRQQENSIQISHSNFRIQYLDHLNSRNFTGLYDFLYSSMTSLMKLKLEPGTSLIS